MKIHIHTLGCKVNQYESQAMASEFNKLGHTLSSDPKGCDAIIVNTCAVTAESVRKSRQSVRRLKQEAPDAIIAVCGCWAQTGADEVRELGADIVFGSGSKKELISAVLDAFETRRYTEDIDDPFSRRVFEELPAGSAENRTRALLKIEDGCVNFCTYCIIPYARGRVRSLPVSSAASAAKELMESGYREIVLTGIEIASYGSDLNGKPTLKDAVCAIAEAAPGCRIRLGSLEPRCITEDFCEAISACGNVCDHFHLSLQSGCDATLSRMRRKYDTARFYESVSLLRKHFPNCGITADLITGFPGETDEEFAETLSFIEKCRFSAMHIFPYSVREGTPAAKMEDQVPKSLKQSRARTAAKYAKAMQRGFLASQVGKTLSVLFETEPEKGVWQGHSANYLVVTAKGENLKNTVLDVRITAVDGEKLIGTTEGASENG